MQARVGTIVCKYGSDPATCVVEVAICAKFQQVPFANLLVLRPTQLSTLARREISSS